MGPPFKPVAMVPLRKVTYKMLFLEAITTVSRVSELGALPAHSELCIIRANCPSSLDAVCDSSTRVHQWREGWSLDSLNLFSWIISKNNLFLFHLFITCDPFSYVFYFCILLNMFCVHFISLYRPPREDTETVRWQWHTRQCHTARVDVQCSYWLLGDSQEVWVLTAGVVQTPESYPDECLWWTHLFCSRKHHNSCATCMRFSRQSTEGNWKHCVGPRGMLL